ncbi:MAG: hypothetical protein WC641_01380 [Patescibacteria group bacterium]
MPEPAKKFIFDGYRHAPEASQVFFDYAVELMDGTMEKFTETIEVPGATAQDWARIPSDLLERLLQNLLLVLGTSYWKMRCAPQIEIRAFALNEKQAAFWNLVYTQGLGEFFFKHQIDFRGLVKFPCVSELSLRASAIATAVARNDKPTCLVPVGGGKDSLVSVELLRERDFDFELFTLSTSRIQEQVMAIVDKPIVSFKRQIDSRLIELSRSDAVWNGHIPITTVYMFAGLLAAALRGCAYVVFSNEASANEGNAEYLGSSINHQWSKSLEAELLIREYIKENVTPDIVPFSLLRPLSEIGIVRRFVKYPKYFPVFSSCNRNFVVGSAKPVAGRGAYWCGSCPKCAFVFAMLSAYLPKQTLLGIFDKDLYADAGLVSLYRDLLGRGAMKPFECVGTPEETALAMHLAQATGEYGGAVMEYFVTEVEADFDYAALEEKLFSLADLSTIPEEFKCVYE